MSAMPINWNPSRRDLRWFAGLLIVFCAVLTGLWWRRTHGTTGPAILVAIGTLLGSLGLAKPGAIRWLYVGWMAAVWPIGWVVSHVLLAAIFWGVITPIGLMLRLANRDPMRKAFDRNASSYWIARPPETSDISRYFRQF